MIWLNNHLSPALATWIASEFGEPCVQVRDIGLARAADKDIFDAARVAASVFITKHRDFAELVTRLGPPPSIICCPVETQAARTCGQCCGINWAPR